MSTSQRIKSQWSVRLTKFSKWHPVISLAPIFSKLRDHQIPDLRLRDHPFREFFTGGAYERLCQKGRMLVLLKSQSPSLFPLINSPFLAWLPGLLSFSLHSPYKIFIWNPGNIDNLTVVSWETLKPRTKHSIHILTVKLQLCIMLNH